MVHLHQVAINLFHELFNHPYFFPLCPVKDTNELGSELTDPDAHLCPLEHVLGDQLAASAEVLSQVPTDQFAFGEVPVLMDEDGHFALE